MWEKLGNGMEAGGGVGAVDEGGEGNGGDEEALKSWTEKGGSVCVQMRRIQRVGIYIKRDRIPSN